MSIINKGTSFANGEQLTADKINDLIDLATFNQDATDSQTTDVNSAGQIVVNQGGIDTAQLATDAVETAKIKDANVTLPKIATQADQTVIANVSGADASPTAVDIVGPSGILVDDDALGTSDTKGATQGNIKAYADAAPKAQMKVNNVAGATYEGEESITFPNGLIMKFGETTIPSSGGSITFATAFPTACINVSAEKIAADSSNNIGVTSFSESQIVCNPTSSGTFLWQAFGY